MPTRRLTSSRIRCSSCFATSTTRSLRGAADVSIRASTPLDQQDPTFRPARWVSIHPAPTFGLLSPVEAVSPRGGFTARGGPLQRYIDGVPRSVSLRAPTQRPRTDRLQAFQCRPMLAPKQPCRVSTSGLARSGRAGGLKTVMRRRPAGIVPPREDPTVGVAGARSRPLGAVPAMVAGASGVISREYRLVDADDLFAECDADLSGVLRSAISGNSAVSRARTR